MFLKFLTGSVAGPIGFGLAIFLFAVLVISSFTKGEKIHGLEQQIVKLENDNKALIKNNGTLLGNQTILQNSVEQCNASVVSAKAAADRVAKAGVDAVRKVQQEQSTTARKIAELSKLPTASCDNAMQILRQGAR